MRFAIIIPVHNSADYLESSIASLRGQHYPSSDFEVFLVDNGSTDRSREILGTAAGVRVLSESRRGAYAARNRAVSESTSEFVAFTDPDCVHLPGWLKTAEVTLMTDASRMVVLGCRRPGNESGLVRLFADYECAKDEYVLSSNDPALYYGYTNNMAVRRSAIQTCGPFDLRARGSDTLFIQRVLARYGCDSVTFAPEMVVNHLEVRSLADYLRKVYIYGRSQQHYRFVEKTRPLRFRERIGIWKTTVRRGRYTLLHRVALGCALVCGLIYWHLGVIHGKYDQWLGTAPRS